MKRGNNWKREAQWFRATMFGIMCFSSTAFASDADSTVSEVLDALGLKEIPRSEPAPSVLPGTRQNKTSSPKVANFQMAQFQLPPPAGRHGVDAEARPITQFLQYQYAYGSESDATYRRNVDLDKRLRDNSLIMAPQVNGYVIYRPNANMEMMLEMILEREVALKEEKAVILPTGSLQPAPKHRGALVVDQAYARFKSLGPFDVTIGRRNFEDDRHWLYDTSLDVAFVKFKHGYFNAEFSVGRKDLIDLDFLGPVQETRIDNYMLYMDYRGIEDIKLAAYAIFRNDRARKEGRPLHMGLRAYGAPSDKFSFWSELAFLGGTDETKRDFAGRAIDVGAIYRFSGLPLNPSVAVGYAFGSGEDNPNGNRNHEFRQTGLQSNEARLAGIPKFKYYGEALDPDLSNLQVVTLDLGFRPTPNITVDLVYHRYRLDKLADEIRNWALTAQMSQVDTHLSKDVGSELDVVLGFRKLFGIRRLGLDLRIGWFYPGDAFLRNEGTDDDPIIRRSSKSIAALAKFWW